MFELRRLSSLYRLWTFLMFFCANPSAWLFFSHCKAVESIKSDKEGWVGSDGSSKRLQSLIFHRKWRIHCVGPKGGNFWKTLLEEKGSEKVQEGGSQCVLTPDDINIQDQRSSHAGGQQKKCSKYLKKENHNHNPSQSAHPPIPKWKIIFFIDFPKHSKFVFFTNTWTVQCTAIYFDQPKKIQTKHISGKRDGLFFFPAAAADQVDGWAVTGQCPLMVTVKSEQKTTRGLGETNKTIEISYMSSQDRMYLVSSTLACQDPISFNMFMYYLCIMLIILIYKMYTIFPMTYKVLRALHIFS